MDMMRDASPLSLAVTAAALLLALFLLLSGSLLLRRKKRNYPPVAGIIFHQFCNLHRLLDYQTDLSRKYKTLRILTPFCNYVYTVDPANIEYMLKTNLTNFGKVNKEDILSRFLAEREKDPSSMSNKYLRDSAQLCYSWERYNSRYFGWLFYLLCKQPDVQEKVVMEVKEATGANDELHSGDFVACLTDEALNDMQYLHAALTEALRLYPAVPLMTHYPMDLT